MVQDIIGVGNITITDLNDSTVSDQPPVNPEVGVIWIDSSGDKNVLRQFNGVKWIRASLDVTQLDKDLSEKVISIETTLGNIGDDGILTYEDRKILVEELNMIVGEEVSTTKVNKYPTNLPSYDTVDSRASGSFANYRLSAREVGIRRGNPEYEMLERRYTELIRHLGQQGLPRPWDIRKETKGDLTSLKDPDEFRKVILDYFLAELALVTETKERAQDMVVSDTTSEDNGVTPFIAAPTQEGGAIRIEIQGFYDKLPTPVPEEYSITIETQEVEKVGDGYTTLGEASRVEVPLPKVIMDDESLIRGSDGKWKIVTPTDEWMLSNTAQNALNNIPSYRGATKVSISDSRIAEVKTLISVTAISASSFREQQAKDYADSAVNNKGSALDVEDKGPYLIPEMPLARLSEYTIEAFIYWGGEANSSIIARSAPRMHWRVGAQQFTPVDIVNGEEKVRDPETRGYLEFSPSTAHKLSSKGKIGDVYIPVKTWTGVAITYDGTRTKLYIGGELAAEQASGDVLVLKDILLGGLRESNWFDGYISNFRVWDRALSPEDVKRYQNRRLDGDEEGLILYYRLNGGNMIYDSGPHGNHITSRDGIAWVEDNKITQDLEREIKTVTTQVTQIADNWALTIHSNDQLVSYINASMESIDIGSSKIELTAGGTATTTKEAFTSIKATADELSLTLNDGKKLAGILIGRDPGNTNKSAMDILADNINLNGKVTFSSFDASTGSLVSAGAAAGGRVDDLMAKDDRGNLTTEIDGGKIRTGTIKAKDIEAGTIDGYKITGAEIEGGTLTMKFNKFETLKVDSIGQLSMSNNRFKVDWLGNLSAGNGGFEVPHDADGVTNSFQAKSSNPAESTGALGARWKFNDDHYIFQGSNSVAFYQNGQSYRFHKGVMYSTGALSIQTLEKGYLNLNSAGTLNINSGNSSSLNLSSAGYLNINSGNNSNLNITSAGAANIRTGNKQNLNILPANKTWVGSMLGPFEDLKYDLGESNYRWNTGYIFNVEASTVRAVSVSAITITELSDIRLKEDIENIPRKLAKHFEEVKPKMYDINGQKQFGYISQDVERALFKYATEAYGIETARRNREVFSMFGQEESYMALAYRQVAAIKDAEKDAKIADLEARLDELERRLNNG